MSDLTGAASLERPADAGEPPKGITTRWNREIELAGKRERHWRKLAEKVLKRFKDEEQAERGGKPGRKVGNKFNILRPNTRVMKAAVYQDPPKPDVRRRFKDKDPLGKAVSEVTERALSFNMDAYEFDTAMEAAVDDMLKPGRAVTRVRYEPKLAPQMGPDGQPMLDEQGKPLEQITWEKVCWDQVQWNNFRIGPARCWKDVPWIAYRHDLTRDQAIKKIPEAAAILETIELDSEIDSEDMPKPRKDDRAEADVFKRLLVWEIWDKGVDGDVREVIFFAPSYKDAPLAVRKDPLGLEEFFDCPRPLYAVYQSDTLEPIEDFRAYADQAKELDNITGRIDGLVAALKFRGLYDATIKAMGNLMSAEENTFLPADEVAALYNQGGLENAVWALPIEKIAAVLVQLYEQREQIKGVIYEITGLSDIMRGQSTASETATAQSIKAQNGAMSIQDRRKAVKRYARDLTRIAAEIICEHFQPETLKAMTGSDYPTEQEKAQITAQMQVLQQQMAEQAAMAPVPANANEQAAPPPQAQPDNSAPPPAPAGPPPEMLAMQDRLAMPSWEQIIEVMRSDQLRAYRIDVETDETAFGDQQAEQKAVVELVGGVTTALTALTPLAQIGAVTPEFVKALLGVAVRRFRVGREIEDAIEELGEGQVAPPADPNAGKVEVEREKLGFDRDKHAQDMEFQKQKHEAEMARAAQQDEFAKTQHSDELQRRDRELDFTERQHQDGIDQVEGAEAMKTFGAEFPQQLQATMQMLAQIGQAVVQSNQATQQLIAQQGQRDAAMMQALTQAIVTGMNQPKRVKRGKDGKISEVVPVAAGAAPPPQRANGGM